MNEHFGRKQGWCELFLQRLAGTEEAATASGHDEILSSVEVHVEMPLEMHQDSPQNGSVSTTVIRGNR
jgi:hypothetical protein